MIKITEDQINEIAELLDSGLLCFIHRENGIIESHPDHMDHMADLEPWQDIIDKIELDFDNYIKIQKMDSSQSFRVMVDFIDTVDAPDLKKQLERILNRPKPFRYFKHEIDESDYRQEWFDFKHKMIMNWVTEQLE